MKKIFLFPLLVIRTVLSFSQKTDKKLQLQIEESVKEFNGDIGIYAKNLRTGKIVTINADSIFPTASIVKLPILIGVMAKIEKRELNYDDELVYKDSLLYEGVDILGSFKTAEKIMLKKVIMLMLTTSDNTASLCLQSLADTGTRINELMDSIGLKNTRVNSRTAGRESNRSNFGWGQTNPRELAGLLEMIYGTKLFSPAACERMMRCLGRNFWDEDEAISQIPPYIEVFSKNGCVDAVRSEVLLVNAQLET